MKRSCVTYDVVRRLGLALPSVAEGTSYGQPALKAKGKMLVCLHRDEDKIVLRMPFEKREELMAADPETYFITDHYREYPCVLVSMAKVHPDALSGLLKMAYQAALSEKKRGR